MIQIKPLSETDVSLRQVYEYIQCIYLERVLQGMNFWATTVSFDEFRDEYEKNSAVVFVAIDDINGELVGSGTIYIRNNGKYKYAHMTNAVVSPNMRRCGIGSKLKVIRQEYAMQNGCSFISCTTGVNAESSVSWHKKNGYKIVGKSYWLGYYSYRFRLQLTPSWLWNSNLFCKLVYIRSCVKLYFKMNFSSNQSEYKSERI